MPALAEVLTLAFAGSTALGPWTAAPDERRARRIRRYFAAFLRLPLRRGLVLTDLECRGTAVWFPPGAWRTGVWHELRLMPSLVAAIGVEGLLSKVSGLAELARRHPALPHYYLNALGTRPEARGRGIGSALLAPVLDRCDRERTPAYLETSTTDVLPLYRRRGFRVRESFTLPSGARVWTLWRDPTSPEVSR